MRLTSCALCLLLVGCPADEPPPPPPLRVIDLAAAELTPTGTRATGAVQLDWDGDGRLDVVISGDAGVVVGMAGEHGYTFVAHDTGFSPRAVAALDATGDGRLDYALLTSDGVRLRFGDGAGHYGAPNQDDDPIRVGGSLLAAGDVDGDGRDDLVVGATQAITVLWGSGGGLKPSTPLPCAGVLGVSLADLGGDGRADVIVPRASGDVAILRFDGTRSPSEPVVLPVDDGATVARAADLDADGQPELLIGTTVGFLRVVDPLGAIPAITSHRVDERAVGLQAMDLDGDGDLDVALLGERWLQRFTNLELGYLAGAERIPVGSDPVALFASDLDGDAAVSVVDRQHAVVVTLDHGRFVGPEDTGSGSGVAVYVGDIDGDGKDDQVIGGGALLTKGQSAVGLGAPEGGHVVTAGDVDGDGRRDVVLAGAGQLWIFPGVTTGLGPVRKLAVALEGPRELHAGDLDGDGVEELVVLDGTDRLVVIAGDGARRDLPLPGAPSSLALADLTGDGRPELVVARQASDRVAVLRADGTSIFEISVVAPLRVAVGDFDGDGQLDVATIGGALGRRLGWLRGLGGGRLERLSGTELGERAAGLVARDLDGDARDELLAVLPGSGGLVLGAGVPGLGGFSTKTFAVVGGATTLAVGDVDGDGVLDVLTSGDGVATVRGLLRAGDARRGADAP
jgi:hypothetical protein